MQINLDVPHYGRDMLWLTAGPDFRMRISGNAGEDVIIPTDEIVQLRWGTSDGSPVAVWQNPGNALVWQGQVNVRGRVDSAHILTIGKREIMIVEITGTPIAVERKRLPSLERLREGPYESEVFAPYPQAEFWYGYLLSLDSPLADFAFQAMQQRALLDCYGTLAQDAAKFHALVGMPALLESLTILG